MNRLRALLNANARSDRSAPSIRADASGDVGHVYIYDVIDSWWGASALGLVAALDSMDGRDVMMHINSPGGDVFEARAMVAAVRAYSGRVDTVIDGLAASAATYLSMAGRTVSMIEGGMYMIHNSWTLAYGNKSELRKTADLLDKIDLTIRTDYARKSGATDDQLQEWMDAETWWTADEALAAKFVDRVITPDDGTDDGATAAARWDLSAYDRAPKITARALPDDAADVAAKAERIQRLNRGRLAALASYHRALLR